MTDLTSPWIRRKLGLRPRDKDMTPVAKHGDRLGGDFLPLFDDLDGKAC